MLLTEFDLFNSYRHKRHNCVLIHWITADNGPRFMCQMTHKIRISERSHGSSCRSGLVTHWSTKTDRQLKTSTVNLTIRRFPKCNDGTVQAYRHLNLCC